jgi:putative proteasome-type protease
MLVYPEGNHITSSKDTPYLQIGESKYGKPILDRILTPDLNLDTCALCALVSMDSTMRSNLSVGPPIETLVYRTDTLTLNEPLRFNEDSEFLRELKRSWDQRLKDAFRQMPPFAWASRWDKSSDGRSGSY